MSPQKTRKRLSGYQFFFQACLKEFKAKYPNSSLDLSQVSSLCAENWQKFNSATKKRFQDEAEAVNKAITRASRKPQRQSNELKKMIKTRSQDKAVNTANKISLSKPQRQSKKLKRMASATKKPVQGQSKANAVNKANTPPSPKPKRQPKKLKKINTATKKRAQNKAVNKANTRPSRKPQSQPKKLKKINTATKKRYQDQSKKLKKETVILESKKPVSSFIHFSREFRPIAMRNHPDLGFGQISRVLSEMWRNADDKTKMKYKRLSLKQSERYRKEMNSNLNEGLGQSSKFTKR